MCNLNLLEASRKAGVGKIFYSSSACIYPEYNQMDPDNPKCNEDSAYPAAPDSEYGWEKLFSKRLWGQGRHSDNNLIRKVLGWEPTLDLETGMRMTYEWISQQVVTAESMETTSSDCRFH